MAYGMRSCIQEVSLGRKCLVAYLKQKNNFFFVESTDPTPVPKQVSPPTAVEAPHTICGPLLFDRLSVSGWLPNDPGTPRAVRRHMPDLLTQMASPRVHWSHSLRLAAPVQSVQSTLQVLPGLHILICKLARLLAALELPLAHPYPISSG